MLSRGERGSVVTLICDGGDRYAGTYYNDEWVRDQGLELAPYTAALETFLERGAFPAGRLRDLDLGDRVPDRVHDLWRDLVHPVGLAGVDRRSLPTTPRRASFCPTHWQPGTTSPHLNCFIDPPRLRDPLAGHRQPGARAPRAVRSAQVCRVLAYLGEPLPVRNLLFDPDNSLVTPVVQPADDEHVPQSRGLRACRHGIRRRSGPTSRSRTGRRRFPRSTATSASLSGKLAPTCLVAHVRGVTYSEEAVVADTNLHPFQFPGARVVLAHNGHLRQFARMRYSLVEHVRPELAERIEGTTDSEWIYALDPLPARRSLRAAGDARARRGDGRRRSGSCGRSAPRTASTPPRRSTCASAPAASVVATRFSFDYGWYPPEDEMLETDLPFVSLWYAIGGELRRARRRLADDARPRRPAR